VKSHVLSKGLPLTRVVKPAHGGEVAEPLVGQLMKQQDVAIEVVAASRRNSKEHRFLSQKSGSGVFHSTVSKAGNLTMSYLGKGKGWAKKLER